LNQFGKTCGRPKKSEPEAMNNEKHIRHRWRAILAAPEIRPRRIKLRSPGAATEPANAKTKKAWGGDPSTVPVGLCAPRYMGVPVARCARVRPSGFAQARPDCDIRQCNDQITAWQQHYVPFPGYRARFRDVSSIWFVHSTLSVP
jgi:hypothetical protein